MKIEIAKEPYAEAKFDIETFKEVLIKEWNFEEACLLATEITMNTKKEIPNESLKMLVNLVMDWGSILDKFKMYPDRYIGLQFYIAKYSDWNKYSPGTLSLDGTVLLDEYTESGEATIIKQSMIKDSNFDFSTFIKSGQFVYVDMNGKKLKWKMEGEL